MASIPFKALSRYPLYLARSIEKDVSKAKASVSRLENQIKNEFSDLQKKLEDLRNDVNTETDEAKKRKKEEELEKLEEQAVALKIR